MKDQETIARLRFAGRQERWAQISCDLSRVEAELAKRDLDEVPTSQFLTQAARLRSEVSRDVGEIRFSAATRHLPSDEYFEEVLDWQV